MFFENGAGDFQISLYSISLEMEKPAGLSTLSYVDQFAHTLVCNSEAVELQNTKLNTIQDILNYI